MSGEASDADRVEVEGALAYWAEMADTVQDRKRRYEVRDRVLQALDAGGAPGPQRIERDCGCVFGVAVKWTGRMAGMSRLRCRQEQCADECVHGWPKLVAYLVDPEPETSAS